MLNLGINPAEVVGVAVYLSRDLMDPLTNYPVDGAPGLGRGTR